MTYKLMIALAVSIVGCAAGSGGVGGPVSGYVLDTRVQAIRPVNGFPGAATLGTPLALPFPVRLAALGRDFALVGGAGDNDRLFLARDLGSGAPSVTVLDGAVAPVTSIVWSTGGAAALLYSRSAGKFQVITGLPDAPRVSAPIDSSPLSAVTAMALNAAADRIVAAGPDAVYGYSPADGGSWGSRLLAPAGQVSSILFRNGGRDVVFASQATNEIIALSGFEAGGGSAVLAGAADGVNTPVALQAANNDRELWVANAGSSSLLALDMAGAVPPQQISLAAAPSRCDPLDWKSLLVLNDVGNAPLLLLDWAQARTVFFVPLD